MEKRPGQLLVETIIGLGILAVILTAVTPLFMVGTKGPAEAWKKGAAENLAKETLAGLKALEEENWNNIYRPLGGANKGENNPYHLVVKAGKWGLEADSDIVSLNGTNFISKIMIDNVSRTDSNGAGEIEENFTPAREDPSTQKVTIEISWPGSAIFKIENYLTRWQNNIWEQTDWAGASGAINWLAGSNKFFSSSQIDNSKSDFLTLSKTGSTPYGNGFIVDTPTILYRLNNTTRSLSMRFTAQKSGSVNQMRVYISRANNSGNITFRYGLQADSGGQPSGTWLAFGTAQTNTTGWLTVNLGSSAPLVAGQIYYLVVQYDSGQQPSSNRYIEVRASSPLNNLYPLNDKADPNADSLTYAGTWQVANYQPIYLLRFSDNTYEGNPYDNSAISYIYQNNIEGEKFTLTSEEKLTGAGLYVGKSRSTNLADSLYVKLTDLNDNSILANEQFVAPTDVSTTLDWKIHNFVNPITLLANHTFRLEFYSPGSNNKDYYNVLDISTPNNAEYIGLTWAGTDAVATRSTGGNPFTDLIFVDLNYRLLLEGSSYAPSGELVSSSFNLGNIAGNGFNKITWQGSTPPNTTIKFKLAANSDNSTWHFVGPNGSEAISDNYTTAAGENIWTGFGVGPNYYLRYKVILESNGVNTPSLDWVRINWAH